MPWIFKIMAWLLPAQLKQNVTRLGLLLLAAVIFIVITALSAKVKNLTVQRDKAIAISEQAKKSLKASERARIVETSALEKVREQDNGRYKFKTDIDIIIDRGRAMDDIALLPDYSRDVLKRVRDRYDNRTDPNSR